MNLFKVILSFLKIGLIGFGGGSALIPVVEKEIVEDKNWVSREEYNTSTIIANITPGALPVKLGALFNQKFSFFSALSVALPGTFMLILFLSLFNLLGENAVKYIEYASIGISSFIILLLYLYIMKVQKEGSNENLKSAYIVIMLISFLLTCGKEIRQIFCSIALVDIKTLAPPLFDIRTIDLMISAFFIILFVGGSKNKIKYFFSIAVAFLYTLSKGEYGLFSEYSNCIAVFMVVLTILSIIYDIKTTKGVTTTDKINTEPIKNIAWFIVLSALLSFIAICVNGAVLDYIKLTIISTFTSFGGGEAYVSVADGLFVQSGYIEPSVFYNQIVATANALPGPILVKIASAIGYVYGCKLGNIYFGYFLSIVGLVLTVSISSIGALIVLMSFSKLKNNERLLNIKNYILPVVCGMLMTTTLSILYETIKVIADKCHLSAIFGILIPALLFIVMNILHKKTNVNDLVLLLLAGGSTLVLFTFSI